MNDQSSSGSNNNPNANPSNRPAGSNPNNNRRHNNQRRRPHNPNPNPNQNRDANQGPGPRPQQANQAQAQAPQGQRRRPNRGHNRPRNPNQQQGQPGQGRPNQPGQPGNNIERIYEKYLNLLDQHLIARRKFHDLFYRADPAQKNKLERNFYNSLNEVREFENRLTPEARVLFEKRNNGLKQDNIYTTNHELPLVGENPPPETECADPHFLQSQKLASYREDKEESVGSAEDYLKYKNLL